MCQDKYNTTVKKYKHLTCIERMQIERWYNKDKKSKKEIADLLNKSERTIRREINRGLVEILNTDWTTRKVYSMCISEDQYRYNMRGKGPNLKIGNDYALKEYIECNIKKNRRSPEAIIADIKNKGLLFKAQICAKTIRNAIALGDVLEIKKSDMIYKKKHVSKNKEKRIFEKIPIEKSIEFRPQEANNREEYGHWEGDLVVGLRKRGAALFTLTERKTREEIIIKIPNKKSESVSVALNKLERKHGRVFYNKFKTITFDNGGEFRDYKALEKSCKRKTKRVEVYYAHPYCSGERGSNENNNRLIRRFIPKGTDITKISEDLIHCIEHWINNYPRAMFNYKSSLEIA